MAITISGDSPNLTSPNITGAVLSAMASSVITSGTAVASTSGTSIDFTSIPSWVKRITVMFNGVSTNGTSSLAIRLGPSTTPETTGYSSSGSALGTATIGTSTSSTHLLIGNNLVAARAVSGQAILSLMNSATNTWTYSAIGAEDGFSNGLLGAGSKSLASTLGVVRITTVNGTDTFDAGSINILFE
jgi:hypothetical protein